MNILEFALAKKMGGPGGVPINNQDKTITQNGTYIADEGFTGLGTVKVNVAREDQTDIEAQLNAVIDGSIAEISGNAASIRQYAFQLCSNLITANFPAATSIGDNAFSGCGALTTANFPAVTSIGGSVFNNCSKLTTANFPAVTSIGGSAFQGCSNLTAVNFPVANSIGNQAFYNCSKLTTANFPVAKSISKNAFTSCQALTTLILRSATMCTLSNTNALNGTPIKSGTGYVYVPRDLVDSYKSATNWSTYASQFRALEDYTVDGTTTGALDSTKI